MLEVRTLSTVILIKRHLFGGKMGSQVPALGDVLDSIVPIRRQKIGLQYRGAR